MTTIGNPGVTETVRQKYGEAARRVLDTKEPASCCGPLSSCCGGAAATGGPDPITSNLYLNGETSELPEAAVLASLGCGNPTALAELRAGRDRCSTSAPAAASTCCSRRGASGRPARRTAWT